MIYLLHFWRNFHEETPLIQNNFSRVLKMSRIQIVNWKSFLTRFWRFDKRFEAFKMVFHKRQWHSRRMRNAVPVWRQIHLRFSEFSVVTLKNMDFIWSHLIHTFIRMAFKSASFINASNLWTIRISWIIHSIESFCVYGTQYSIGC